MSTYLEGTVTQYMSRKQGVKPKMVVVTPLAALALEAKKELSQEVMGVPIVSREFDETDVAKELGVADIIGVFLQNDSLRACDLIRCPKDITALTT